MTTEYTSLREKIAAEKADREDRYAGFEKLWNEAVEAGHKAATECVPNPMVVTSGTEEWFVEEGLCGFAEVVLSKGNTSFAYWAKKHAGFAKNYSGKGLYFWVKGYGQSYERKAAFARAAADVLNDAGIEAYASARLD